MSLMGTDLDRPRDFMMKGVFAPCTKHRTQLSVTSCFEEQVTEYTLARRRQAKLVLLRECLTSSRSEYTSVVQQASKELAGGCDNLL